MSESSVQPGGQLHQRNSLRMSEPRSRQEEEAQLALALAASLADLTISAEEGAAHPLVSTGAASSGSSLDETPPL